MTTKPTNNLVQKQTWSLDLPSQADLEQAGLDDYRSARKAQRVPTKGMQLVTDEGEKELLTIDYERQKGAAVVEGNTEMHQLSGHCFYETLLSHDELVKASAATEYEEVMQQFVMYDLKTLARQNQKLNEVIYAKFVGEVTRVVYKDDEPEVIVQTVIKEVPQPSLLKRIIG